MAGMNNNDWCIGYRLLVTWGALDIGPVTFTGSVGGATSGTLTAVPQFNKASFSGTGFMVFSDGETRSVTISGTGVSWTGALNASSITTARLYNFSNLDAVLNQCKTAYNKPKHLVVTIQPMSFGASLGSNDSSILPLYIQNSNTYGTSPVSGSFGWWGASTSGASTGAYTAAIYRPAVMAELIRLYQAMGAHYDSDPFFEGVMLQEMSATTGDAINNTPKDATYSDAAFVTQLELLGPAAIAAFPTSTISFQNTWLNTATPTQSLEGWMMANRIMPGETDTHGHTKFSTNLTTNISWGVLAVMGITAPGSTYSGSDMRPTVRFWCDVEGPDLGAYGFGTRFFNGTPQDTITAVNFDYKASHVFWTKLESNSQAPSACWWENLGPLLAVNPLDNTAYPGNYP